MGFSQTIRETQCPLKVVDIDQLRQANGSNGVIIGGHTEPTTSSTVETSSFSEEFLKPEPLFESIAMNHGSDSEFFQDLVQWCSAPAKEEQVQITDSSKQLEERALYTPHTPISPQGWDVNDVKSPIVQPGFYNISPIDNCVEDYQPFNMERNIDQNIQFQEQFLDLNSLPVVLGDLTSEEVCGTVPWQVEPTPLTNSQTNYTNNYTNTQYTLPYMDPEETIDLKYPVIPTEVESNDVVVSDYIINDQRHGAIMGRSKLSPPRAALHVDVARASLNWTIDTISTPEVLNYVEQLEKEDCPQVVKPPPVEDDDIENFNKSIYPAPTIEYETTTPKSDSHDNSENEDTNSRSGRRKRRLSEDSDASYTPYIEQTTRKYKRRKPSVPIKDMILALEGSPQLTKARRGRPPKRRESTVSSICSIDESASNTSTQEIKYRELRDKNNEASARSRMNRKLKELQIEQLAMYLEERNKKLKVRADILEDMTKRLKDALMTAILHK